MEFESNKNKTHLSDEMPIEGCSFQYTKKRKNPYPENYQLKHRQYLINNSLKNIITKKKTKNINN